jgi:cellulose synthase (UDP-forming)
MITQKSPKARISSPLIRNTSHLRQVGFAFISLVVITSIFMTAWCFGLFNLSSYNWAWVTARLDTGEYMLLPVAIAVLFTQIVTKISPIPLLWSKFLVVTTLLTLIFRYLIWRSVATLNLVDPLSSFFSLILFGMEALVLLGYAVQLFLMLGSTNRSREADRMSANVIDGTFQPFVDILIPTYNEPAMILRRTIIGCQALEYPHKQVYLLDDTSRPEIQRLAEELGCEYIARPDNRFAKAGNLNHAIAKTNSELIVVFDADFIPTKNFLTRTVGFFQDHKTGLVQTHQCFYNSDPLSLNLGIDQVLTHEVEIFSRQYQPVRDGADSTLCYGSAFVVSRSALAEVGGFFEGTLGEDYYTGIGLSAKGYKVIYLNENLSAGLVAENMPAHIAQRQRWARGTLQSFFIAANPLNIPGLRLRQRIAHLEGIMQWFAGIYRVAFLLIPLVYFFGGIPAVKSNLQEWIYFFLPLYIVQFSTFSWLNYRSRSALMSDIYSLLQCFPIGLTAIQTLISPFSKRFRVTPKGTSRDRFIFNWGLALPLIVIFIFTAIGLSLSLYNLNQDQNLLESINSSETSQNISNLKLGIIWAVYNLFVLGVAIFSFLDVPRHSPYEYFQLKKSVRLMSNGNSLQGLTRRISEIEMEVCLDASNLEQLANSSTVKLLFEDGLELKGRIAHIDFRHKLANVTFEQVTVNQYRSLVEMLFCQPNQWQNAILPGEHKLLWLLIQVVLKPLNPLKLSKRMA